VKNDLDWTNPVILFTVGSNYDSFGITYDSKTGTLWTSNWNGGTSVSNYALDGSLLSSFAGFSQIGGLAYDAADATLWMTQFASTTLYQFSKSGTLLQSGSISDLDADTLWSGEIVERAPGSADAGVPEPGSLLLFGGGAVLLALRRRK
jgi:DNA-binding beta-propeller fold protein YncE